MSWSLIGSQIHKDYEENCGRSLSNHFQQIPIQRIDTVYPTYTMLCVEKNKLGLQQKKCGSCMSEKVWGIVYIMSYVYPQLSNNEISQSTHQNTTCISKDHTHLVL